MKWISSETNQSDILIFYFYSDVIMPARNRETKKLAQSEEPVLEEVTEEDEILAEMEEADEDYVADEDDADDEIESDPDSKVMNNSAGR